MSAASIEEMECSSGTAAARKNEPVWEYHLRKYLMLLASLVATATYAAGLSPPGGVWQEKDVWYTGTPGTPILGHSPRYLAFFYFNATAFAASLVVNVLLLVLNEKRAPWLAVLRFVMVLDLLAFMGAFATGSCGDVPTTVYIYTLVVVLAAYVGIHIILAWHDKEATWQSPVEESHDDARKLKEHRKVLLVLATFAAGISYTAGLSPPGGFRNADENGVIGHPHNAGDLMLKAHQSPRLMTFFYCNTTAFVASLLIIMLLLGRRLQRYYARMQLYGFILVVLLGLLGAYAAGSSREEDMAYVVVLVAAVPLYIFLVMVVKVLVSDPLKNSVNWLRLKSISARASHWLQERGCHLNQTDGSEEHSSSPARELFVTLGGSGGQGRTAKEGNTSNKNEGIEKAKSLILLLATLAATITYQAGMDPPGGVWQSDALATEPPHKAGDPILLSTHATRYKVFFYCNSTAFVASLVVILMVQNKSLMRGHALEVAMLLDLFGLIGAYAAGSCREVSTSIYVTALAGAVFVYVVIHVVFFTLENENLSDEEKRRIDKRRKRLLLLAILVATMTYQAGLTPPGGFWTEDQDFFYNSPGSPIIQSYHGNRYLTIFYCNSTSFMASIALIIMLVNPNLYRPGIRCYALYVCMVVALLGLMGAYAAGSAWQTRTSIYIFVLELVSVVVAFIVVQLLLLFEFFQICAPANADGGSSSGSTSDSSSSESEANDLSSTRRRRQSGSPKSNREESSTSSRRKYLMLLAILAASVTYQAGLKPPGGVLESGEAAGNPVLRVSDQARYQVFFYCNSTSFVASVVVIVLLLQESLQDRRGLLIYAMNMAIVLDLLGLLGAYAAGSSREWNTSGYVIALTAAVLAYVGFHLVICFVSGRIGRGRVSSSPQQLPIHAQPKGTKRCSSSPC